MRINLFYNEASLLITSGQQDEAITLLESQPIEEAEYYCYLAHARLRQGRNIDAQKAARKACELDASKEAAWIALAYTLGFPVVEGRQNQQKTALSSQTDDAAQLREAVKAAAKAAEILKGRDRPHIRAEVLAYALAFLAALNEDDKALELGKELIAMGDSSETFLQNLFFLQMRNGNADEALSIAEKMITAGSKNAALRRAQALVALGQSEPALQEWEQIRKASAPAALDEDWVEIASRSWCAAHQHERALTLLDEMLLLKPESADLYLERARVFEELGNLEKAETALTKAESLAPNSAQVAVDYGTFLFQRKQWNAAILRFNRVEAASAMSPLHRRYLMCVYNSGDRDTCLRLVNAWRSEGRGYSETLFALGARCHIFSEDFPLAREFLEELNRKGSDCALEHRKLLAQTYLRLNELEEAYNLLTRVTAESPLDAEALILLAHICTARGRHEEAILRTQAAVEMAPDNQNVRAALFGAMLALPKGFTPSEQSIAAHQKNTEELARRWPKLLRAIEFEPELKAIRKELQKREVQVRRVFKVIDSQPMPFGFLSIQTATSPYATWRSAIRDSKRGVRMCLGTIEAQTEQLANANEAGPIAVDLLALFTFQGLGLLSKLAEFHPVIYAHISLLDAVVWELQQLRDHPDGGHISSNRGRLLLLENDPAEQKRTRTALEAIRVFLKRAPVRLVGLSQAALSDERLTQVINACGAPFALPVLVAKERAVPLLSDDAILRSMGGILPGIRGFCTHLQLRAARDSSLLANEEYQDASLQMLEWSYHFVAHDPTTLPYLFRRSAAPPSTVAKILIKRVLHYSENSYNILIGFFFFLRTLSPRDPLYAHRNSWAIPVWQAILAMDSKPPKIYNFVVTLSKIFLTRPERFFSTLVWAIRYVPEILPLRKVFIAFGVQLPTVYSNPAKYPDLQEDRRQAWLREGAIFNFWVRAGAI